MMYFALVSGTLFDILSLFNATLQQLFTVPELALFLAVALLLMLTGVLTWIFRRGKRL